MNPPLFVLASYKDSVILMIAFGMLNALVQPHKLGATYSMVVYYFKWVPGGALGTYQLLRLKNITGYRVCAYFSQDSGSFDIRGKY
jgi:hypothetical protein